MRAVSLVLLLYLAVWLGTAWVAGQRGSAGFDLERRGGAILTAVSIVEIAAALLLTPLALVESFSRSSRRGRHVDASVMHDTWRRTRAGLTAVGAAVALGTCLTLIVSWASPAVTGAMVLHARATTLAVCAAAGGLALLSSAWFEDVHDAAAATYVVLAMAALGPYLATPLIMHVADARALTDAVLATNPFVGVASATGFDLLRTDALYRSLPFGQRLFEYPAWSAVAGIYATVAACCVTGAFWFRSKEEVRCV